MPALPIVDTIDGLQWAPGNAAGASARPSLNPGAIVGGMMGGDQTAVGTGDLTADHNTPIHVAGLILLGLGLIIGLKYAGFRFNVDAGVGL